MSASSAGPALAPGFGSAPNSPSGRATRRNPHRRVRAALALLDPIIAVGCLVAGLRLRGLDLSSRYEALAVVAALLCVLLFHAEGVYRLPLQPGRVQHCGEVLTAWGSVVVALLALGSLTKSTAFYSRVAVTVWVSSAAVVLVSEHMLALRYLEWLRCSGRAVQRAVVAPLRGVGAQLAREIQQDAGLGISLVGYFDDGQPGVAPGLPRLGGLDDLPGYLRAASVDRVYLYLEPAFTERLRSVIEQIEGGAAEVCVVPHIFSFELLHTRFISLKGIPILSLGNEPDAPLGGVLKRALDLLIALPATLLLSPLLLALAWAVRLDSPGPALFRQRRYGLNGHEILVYKFRTMKTCEDGENVPQARRQDPRVTRVGAFLRRSSLDELPQLLNVIAGSMSLVGPRPHPVALNEFYRDKLRGYMLRHRVRPGITGLAQVSGSRGETETLAKMQKRLDYDLDYIRRWSLLLDLSTLARTVPALWRNRDVY